MKESLSFIFSILLLSSCTYFKSKEEGNLIATVNDKNLYERDISELFKTGMSTEDSIEVATTYIDKWVKDNLLLQKAELNLTLDQKDFEKQLENYRNSLIIFNYEKRLVEQNLDTNIEDSDIEAYYRDNAKNFELKDNIVKVVYVKITPEAPKVDDLRRVMQLKKEEDFQLLEEYCVQFAEKYFIDTSEWLLFSEYEKLANVNIENETGYIQSKQLNEWSDSTGSFFSQIIDHKIKSSLSPIEFAKDEIKSILLNKRKLLLIAEMKQNIYEEAVRKKQFEVYTQ
ncbi:hypothetical protein OAB47_05885 [Vicingaceae bacterium]|nr:hypothetical protein [Vicingaceae bacterium]